MRVSSSGTFAPCPGAGGANTKVKGCFPMEWLLLKHQLQVLAPAPVHSICASMGPWIQLDAII